MRLVSSVIVAALAIVAPLAAKAQDVFGFTHAGSMVTLSFNLHNGFGSDPYDENYTVFLSARSDYLFGDTYGLGVTASYIQEQYLDEYFSDRLFLGLHPFLRFDEGQAGLYFQYGWNNEWDENESAYGVEGFYEFGDFTVEGYAGIYENDGDFNSQQYGLGGLYQINPSLGVFATYRLARLNAEDWTLASIGATYMIGGAGGSSIPAFYLSGEVSQFGGGFTGDNDWNQFSLTLNVPLGNGRRSLFGDVRHMDAYYD